jgi:hypothetical protein
MRKDPSGMRQVLGGWLGQEAVLRPNLTIPDFQKKKKSHVWVSVPRDTVVAGSNPKRVNISLLLPALTVSSNVRQPIHSSN